jgi:exopolyphosphatase/guanosine-5'-triphosphate,3'-diphosphate pyrophosphatase
MCRKYSVDLKSARHVANLSAMLFERLHPLHQLTSETGKLLEAAAYLHNTGHFISDTGHHKHSQYVVMNSDLPGFTAPERQLIAMLCRYHRKSMPASRHVAFETMPAERKRVLQLLTPLLRIAVALESSNEQKVQTVDIQLSPAAVSLTIPPGADTDLEMWAADRAGDSFRQIYGLPLSVTKSRR